MVESLAVKCPQCGSQKTWRDGIRHTQCGEIQRYLCKLCGFRFSEPSGKSQVNLNITSKQSKSFHSAFNLHNRRVAAGNFSIKETSKNLPFTFTEDFGVHNITNLGKQLNTFPYKVSNAKVCVSDKEAKNMAATEMEKQTVAGNLQTQDVRGKIVEFTWYLKKQGRKNGTLESYASCLNNLMTEGANLLNPESVKETLALNETWNPTTKATMTIIYNGFIKWLGLKWDKPKYKQQRKMPFIPTEQEIDSLIAGSPKKLATILQLLKETASRIGEALQVQWIDINEKAQTITINSPEKNSYPGIYKVSAKLIGMLNSLPKKNEKIFNKANPNTAQLCLSRARKRIAAKLQNPRLLQVTFHTFRHWKATMEYHKTRDILHVQNLLRHRKIDNTLIYVNLEAALFHTENNEFHVKTASTTEEIKSLLEVGFEYICEKDGVMFLRKRK